MDKDNLKHSGEALSPGDLPAARDEPEAGELWRSLLNQRTGTARTEAVPAETRPELSSSLGADDAVRDQPQPVQEPPESWVRQLLRPLTYVALVIGLPVAAFAIYGAYSSGRTILILCWILAYLPLLLSLGWSRTPYRLWVAAFLGLLFGAGLLGLLQFGYRGAGTVLFLSVPVFATALLGGLAGAVSLGFVTITQLTLSWLSASGLVVSLQQQAGALDTGDLWWRSSVLLAVGAGLVFVAARLRQHLDGASSQNRGLAEDLSAHQARLKVQEDALERRALQLQAVGELGRLSPYQLDADQVLDRLLEVVLHHVRCHAAGIFVTDESGEGLELYGATGEGAGALPAEGLRLDVGSASLVGWAAEQREATLVSDVLQDYQYSPHPLAPETLSEVAVPLIAGPDLVGVLDVQAKERAAFDEADLRFLHIVGDWAATAFQDRRRATVRSMAGDPLYLASSRLCAAGTTAEVVDAIVDLVAEAQAGTCLVAEFVRGPDGELDSLVCLKAWRRGGKAGLAPGARLPLTGSSFPVGLLEASWRIPNVQSDDRLPLELRTLLAGMGVQALVSFPLQDGSVSFGQVLVLYGETRPLSPRVRQLYDLLESQAGMALKRARRLDDAYARARLHQDAQRALDEMQALNTIAATVGESLEMEDVLQGILQQTLALTGYDVGLISLVDPASDQLYLAVEHGLPEALQIRLRDQGMERTLCDYVYRKSTLLSASDFAESAPVDVETLSATGLHSYLGLPLESRGKVLGTVCIFSHTPHSPQPQLVPLLEGLGRQAGVAIENAQLFEQARRRVQRERTVSELASSMREILDLETVLKTAARGIRQAMDLPAVTVRLVGGDGDTAPPGAQ